MTNPNKCIICGSEECKKYIIETNSNGVVEKWKYECKYCRKYEIDENEKFLIDVVKNKALWKSSKFYINLLQNISQNLYKIQCYIREQNDEFNETPYLTEEKIKTIINLPDKSIKEQFDLFLLNLYKDNFNDDLEILRIKSWIENKNIFVKIVRKAQEKNFIKVQFTLGEFFKFIEKLTFDGIEYVENLLQPNKNSKKIFLAFKFDDELNKIFNETISDMIRNLELNPMIVNQDTTSHDEKISDKIIGEIKSSKILIADLTYHSQNVYYEIGYTMGMGIPIILTCKKDFMQNVAFDINQYPVFEWEDENELKEKIENRIKVLL